MHPSGPGGQAFGGLREILRVDVEPDDRGRAAQVFQEPRSMTAEPDRCIDNHRVRRQMEVLDNRVGKYRDMLRRWLVRRRFSPP